MYKVMQHFYHQQYDLTAEVCRCPAFLRPAALAANPQRSSSSSILFLVMGVKLCRVHKRHGSYGHYGDNRTPTRA